MEGRWGEGLKSRHALGFACLYVPGKFETLGPGVESGSLSSLDKGHEQGAIS